MKLNETLIDNRVGARDGHFHMILEEHSLLFGRAQLLALTCLLSAYQITIPHFPVEALLPHLRTR